MMDEHAMDEPVRDLHGRAVTGLHDACGGRGCAACFGTGASVAGPTCRCGHPASLHVRGECVAATGPGWAFCGCEVFRAGAVGEADR